MASQNTRKPVLSGTGSAEFLNCGEAFDAAVYKEINAVSQGHKRLARYTLNADLLVQEAQYV